MKREYDSAIGGDVTLDTHLQTYRYANAAIDGIRTLLAATQQRTGTKLIFQTLPKHIRRRAMSHHPKRLPRKYRGVHIAQMAKSGKQRIMRRPSRKFRRRPRNLMQDYLRRQRRHVWLETHIWHARRFHMIERWGYRLPLTSCDKTYRSCYRATSEHCLVQDISFYVCLELSGKLSHLVEGLKKLSNNGLTTSFGLTIKAVTYLNGQREGSIDLFRKNSFPEGVLCRATFMWRPTTSENFEDENLERTLWLWIHPSVYNILLEELISVFELDLIKKEENELTDDSVKKKADNVTKKQEIRFRFMTKNLALIHIKRYVNSSSGVSLTNLKDTLNRFRLTGPLSQSVLVQAFKPKDICNSESNNDKSLASSDWFCQLAVDDEFCTRHSDQAKYWKQCKFLSAPAALRPNMILALDIVDPRLQRPIKRTKARPENIELNVGDTSIQNKPDLLELLVNVPKTLAHSPLWDEKIRLELQDKMLDTHTWCELRQKHAIVPGAQCAFENHMQPVPVILIQRPGVQDSHKKLNYGCGWDVIAPVGYGMPIWLTLIMWGAKPGGLRELHTLAREMGTEVHLPDTIAGRQQATDRSLVAYDKYFRLPPGKRHNYRKLAIVSPFRPPWSQLVQDWVSLNANATESSFFVERDWKKLICLNKLTFNLKSARKEAIDKVDTTGLIQLQLRMRTRGNIGSNALICLPTAKDVKTHYKNILKQSNTAVYTEPLQPDLNEKERKVLRLEHKKQLKRLRKRRLREKRKLQETSTKRVIIRPANTSSLVSEHFKSMCKLWLPNEDCSTYLSVRKQCSRETFGYVTEASFSFTKATVCAVGYVTIQGLQKLLKMFKYMKKANPLCLLRDINSQHYYFATFEVSQNP